MTKKLSKGFSEFFSQFSIEDFKVFKNLNWPEIIRKARELNEKFNRCQNCGKKEQKYSCNVKQICKGKFDHGIFIEKFCSLDCFNEYLNKHVYNNQLINYPELLEPELKNSVIEFLAWCLNPKELKELNKKQILALTNDRIKNYEDAQKCTYCGKKEQTLELNIFKSKTTGIHNILYGDFCSKKCLKKYVEKL